MPKPGGFQYLDKDFIYSKIESEEYGLRFYNGKSVIWDSIKEVINEKGEFVNYVRCDKCKSLFRYQHQKSGTSSLRKHTTQCTGSSRKLPFKRIKEEISSINIIVRDDSIDVPFHNSSILTILKDQNKISDSSSLHISEDNNQNLDSSILSISKEDHSKILSSSLLVCVEDFRPFSVFSGRGMKNYSQTLIDIGAAYGPLNVQDFLPSQSTISKHVKKLATDGLITLMAEIVDILRDETNVALKVDLWTDDYRKKDYFSISCHYITQDWQLHEICLGCKEFVYERKTAENIKEEIFDYLQKIGFSLNDLMTKCIFVSNRELHIRAALDNNKCFPCTAHALDIILYHTFSSVSEPNFQIDLTNDFSDGYEYIEELSKLLNCIKNLVSYLKGIGLLDEMPSLKKDSASCWNLKLMMLMGVAEEEENIKKILQTRGETDRLSGINFDVVKLIVDFLEPFLYLSEKIEADKYITFHVVALIKAKLSKHLAIGFGDLPLTKKLKEKANRLLSMMFEVKDMHLVATFLCPKFRKLSFLSTYEKNNFYSIVRNLLDKIGTPIGKKRQKAVKRKLGFVLDLSEFMDEIEENRVQDEVDMYINAPIDLEILENENLISGIDTLLFWKLKEKEFPKLAKLARSVLCIPATVASSGNTFSKAARKSRIHSDTINALSILHSIADKVND